MLRLSTVAVSTLVPALNVRSTTLPLNTFLRVVRTNAPPLPGLTCWNSTTVHRSPSRLRTSPFLRSLVVAMACLDLLSRFRDPASLPLLWTSAGRPRRPARAGRGGARADPQRGQRRDRRHLADGR